MEIQLDPVPLIRSQNQQTNIKQPNKLQETWSISNISLKMEIYKSKVLITNQNPTKHISTKTTNYQLVFNSGPHFFTTFLGTRGTTPTSPSALPMSFPHSTGYCCTKGGTVDLSRGMKVAEVRAVCCCCFRGPRGVVEAKFPKKHTQAPKLGIYIYISNII